MTRTTPAAWTASHKVEAFRQATGANELTAVSYLEAEEGDVLDALTSYHGDKVAGMTRAAAAQKILSGRILAHMRAGLEVDAAFDAVMGAGAFRKLAGDVYDALRAKAAH